MTTIGDTQSGNTYNLTSLKPSSERSVRDSVAEKPLSGDILKVEEEWSDPLLAAESTDNACDGSVYSRNIGLQGTWVGNSFAEDSGMDPNVFNFETSQKMASCDPEKSLKFTQQVKLNLVSGDADRIIPVIPGLNNAQTQNQSKTLGEAAVRFGVESKIDKNTASSAATQFTVDDAGKVTGNETSLDYSRSYGAEDSNSWAAHLDVANNILDETTAYNATLESSNTRENGDILTSSLAYHTEQSPDQLTEGVTVSGTYTSADEDAQFFKELTGNVGRETIKATDQSTRQEQSTLGIQATAYSNSESPWVKSVLVEMANSGLIERTDVDLTTTTNQSRSVSIETGKNLGSVVLDYSTEQSRVKYSASPADITLSSSQAFSLTKKNILPGLDVKAGLTTSPESLTRELGLKYTELTQDDSTQIDDAVGMGAWDGRVAVQKSKLDPLLSNTTYNVGHSIKLDNLSFVDRLGVDSHFSYQKFDYDANSAPKVNASIHITGGERASKMEYFADIEYASGVVTSNGKTTNLGLTTGVSYNF